jgi:2,3-bisphosphoglycerate-dependent phosphoglycerate mutase
MPYLVLVRHGQSQWNELGKITGQADVPLTALGISQARAVAKVIQDIDLHVGYTSELQRAHETLRHILEASGHPNLPVTRSPALNERHFGIYEGRVIKDAIAELGEDRVEQIRHSWDEPIPGGESIKQTHTRVKAYYDEHILPDLKAGKNVILAAHGIMLRTVVKDLDQLPDDQIQKGKLANAQVKVYKIDPTNGGVISKETRTAGGSA